MNEAPPISRYTTASPALRLPDMAKSLAEFLAGRNYEAYLFGGTIRDALLGCEAADIDIAVSEDAASVGRDVVDAFGGSWAQLRDECDRWRAS